MYVAATREMIQYCGVNYDGLDSETCRPTVRARARAIYTGERNIFLRLPTRQYSVYPLGKFWH